MRLTCHFVSLGHFVPFEMMESHCKRFLLERSPGAIKLLQRALGATNVSTFVFHTNVRPVHVQSLLQAMPAGTSRKNLFSICKTGDGLEPFSKVEGSACAIFPDIAEKDLEPKSMEINQVNASCSRPTPESDLK